MAAFLVYRSEKQIANIRISPNRYFSGLAKSPDIHFQNSLPGNHARAEIREGQRGEVDSIMFIEYERDEELQNSLVRINTINHAERVFAYSVLSGTYFDARMTERIFYEMKAVDRPGGGCIVKLTVTHYTKPGVVDQPTVDQTKAQGLDILEDSVRHTEEI